MKKPIIYNANLIQLESAPEANVISKSKNVSVDWTRDSTGAYQGLINTGNYNPKLIDCQVLCNEKDTQNNTRRDVWLAEQNGQLSIEINTFDLSVDPPVLMDGCMLPSQPLHISLMIKSNSI